MKQRSKLKAALWLSLSLYFTNTLLAQDGASGINIFGGQDTKPPPSTAPSTTSSKRTAPSQDSPFFSGSSATKFDRVGDEPALKVGFKFQQHQKVDDSTRSNSKTTSAPPTLEDPLAPAPQNPNNIQKGEIVLSQILFDGYISFLSKGHQFGALDFGIPLRQLKSSYSGRPSGTEFGGMELSLVAGERGVGSFGIGAEHVQSPILNLVKKHDSLKGHFYLERGGFSGRQKGPRFLVQMGPELVIPLRDGDHSGLQYDPMYGGKILLGYATSSMLAAPMRVKFFGNYYRVNRVIENQQQLEGGGHMAVGGTLDFNIAGDLWIGVEGLWAATKPQGRQFIYGNPEIPALYGNSIGAFIQAAAF